MGSNEFNEEMSFQELYNIYYSYQMRENTVPLVKSFFDIQKNVMKRLETSNLKKLNKSKENIFLGQGNLNQLVLFNKYSNEEQIENYLNQMENEVFSIKETIKNKLIKHMYSKEFKINLELSSECKKDEPIGPERKILDIFMKFKNLNPEDALGLYYILHNDVPLTEFFKEQYGFTLKIAELPEVKEKINSIRELHGIKTPRDLVKTIDQNGRREESKRKQTSLSYAIFGESEIYNFINGYMNLNFGISAKSNQGIIFPFEEDSFAIGACEYNKLIVQRGNTEKEIKNKWGVVWTGDMEISFFNERLKSISSPKQNNFEESPRIPFGYSKNVEPDEFVEKFCAYTIEKFVDKDLTSKLKIGLAKKYY